MGLSPNALKNDRLATVTVQGTSTDQPCQIATGLSVAPLNNPKRKIQLPTTYIQNEIPSASQEVPTRREVAQMPGFEHLAPNFHYTDKGWSTILLIGRNCIEAQMQRQVSSPRNKSQLAAETPLGWVIIGPRSPCQPGPHTRHRQTKLAKVKKGGQI